VPKRNVNEAMAVRSPCTESWDEMIGNDRVRFCSHCALTVNNISKLTRRDAMRLVRKSEGRICVRYEAHPVTGRPVFITRMGRAAKRTGITAGVISSVLALADRGYSQGDPSAIVELARIEQPEPAAISESRLSGYLLDPAGAAIPFATVSIYDPDTFQHRITSATMEGFYEFNDLPPGRYTLKIEAAGFKDRQIEGLNVSEAAELRYDAAMELLELEAAVEVRSDNIERSVLVGVVAISFSSSHNAEPNKLVAAVLDEDLEAVRELIIGGAKLNVRDRTLEGISPLHAAVETGNLEITQLLLAYGAKPNLRDHQKRTPLMVLDEDADPQLLQLLLSYGAEISLTDGDKNTVLHHFVEFDEYEIASLLVRHGADPNARNKKGKTPLMLAAESSNLDAMRALLEGGADARALTKKKRLSAFDLAGSDEARTLLHEYGAVAYQRP
jgi:ankyrin repeat protein